MIEGHRGLMPVWPFSDVYFLRIPEWIDKTRQLFWAEIWFGLLELRDFEAAWGFKKRVLACSLRNYLYVADSK
jgi:hypothetical protein